MSSRLVPDLFIAVICCTLNKIMSIYSDWFSISIIYFCIFIICCITYKDYPLTDMRAGVISCLYTFSFVLFPYSSDDWKKFFLEGLSPVLGRAFIFATIQFTAIYCTLKKPETNLKDTPFDKWVRDDFPTLTEKLTQIEQKLSQQDTLREASSRPGIQSDGEQSS